MVNPLHTSTFFLLIIGCPAQSYCMLSQYHTFMAHHNPGYKILHFLPNTVTLCLVGAPRMIYASYYWCGMINSCYWPFSKLSSSLVFQQNAIQNLPTVAGFKIPLWIPLSLILLTALIILVITGRPDSFFVVFDLAFYSNSNMRKQTLVINHRGRDWGVKFVLPYHLLGAKIVYLRGVKVSFGDNPTGTSLATIAQNEVSNRSQSLVIRCSCGSQLNCCLEWLRNSWSINSLTRLSGVPTHTTIKHLKLRITTPRVPVLWNWPSRSTPLINYVSSQNIDDMRLLPRLPLTPSEPHI